MSEALAPANIYTEEDYYNLPENVRAELIDGQIYNMTPPSRRYQTIAQELFSVINSYIKLKGGFCEAFLPCLPFFCTKMTKTMWNRIFP